MKIIKSKFAFVRARRRKERGLTQRQLGERIAVHSKRVSAWERGERVLRPRSSSLVRRGV